ncbi:hypothetical protein [Paenimyroides aestuarii]|uniref:Uncharacterized protein n=1 Tax=Paenimyroides aestuarii TaxID=2968490 RepID=A0ABY5NV81_9FLAO|nr:hypothetical protein [Paenimyroides aestuarii]UUV22302.1 hypothetical protein NPX36_04505 [Paenimyroides aestuarii]
MKRTLVFLLLILVAGILIEGCSTINLSPKLLFNSGKFSQFPTLDDGLQAEGISINRITQSSNNEIRYFPEKNFFMVVASSKAGHFNPIKIDSMGNKVFGLNINENYFKGQTIEIINCFLIAPNQICDFSSEKPTAEPFTEVLNKESTFSEKDWVERFGSLYSSSDIVLYSYRSDLPTSSVVYFQNQGKWIKLYTSTNHHFIYANSNQVVCEINNKKIPHKWHEEIYLKDVQKNTYSNVHRYSDEYITPFNSDGTFFPNQTLKYPQSATIKTLAFAKETYTSEGYYNPGIPVQFYGTGYYALEIENSVLNFKTVASKEAFFGKVETDLYLFVLPTKYANQSVVSFLSYDYGTNYHENDKKGVYVIRKN